MRRSPTIGLHMTAGEEDTRRRAEGVLRYVAECGSLQIADFCYPDDNPDMSRPPPWTGKVDGVIVAVPGLPGILAWLRSGNVPIVAVGSDLSKSIWTVCSSRRSLARFAVEHFHQLGIRHFVFVGYRHTEGSADLARAVASELAAQKLRLDSYHTERLLSGTYTDFASLDEVEPELVSLIRDAKKPVAVVAINDRFAAAVCRIAHALGLAIPGDVAVLGMRDFDIARLSSPPISSIRANDERIGYEAAKLLHRLMRSERPARRGVQVPALELVERESTVGRRRAPATDVDRAREYIQQRACDGIGNKDVAAHVHMPLRTFELQFAEATGNTVGEELREARLARAKHLLATTDLSVASVARLIAMNAGSHLNDFFRRWAGTTPIKYRKQCREGQ